MIFFNFCSSDADAGSNGELSYSIISGDTRAFMIDSRTGTIKSKVSFDRETKVSYSLTVRARDHGQTPQDGTATVDISILDVNDNKPVITNVPATKQVPEDKNTGEVLFVVTATDQDLGKLTVLGKRFTRATSRLFVSFRSFSLHNAGLDKIRPAGKKTMRDRDLAILNLFEVSEEYSQDLKNV